VLVGPNCLVSSVQLADSTAAYFVSPLLMPVLRNSDAERYIINAPQLRSHFRLSVCNARVLLQLFKPPDGPRIWFGSIVIKKSRKYFQQFSPGGGVAMLKGYEKIAIFDQYLVLSRKRYKTLPELQWKTNTDDTQRCKFVVHSNELS